jgi:hypothetical protein
MRHPLGDPHHDPPDPPRDPADQPADQPADDPPGDPPSERRHIDWTRPRTALERLVADQRSRRAGGSEADAHAMSLTRRLEDAIVDFETRGPGFDRAIRKSDHVEELRRALGRLLDILADWEMLADRAG